MILYHAYLLVCSSYGCSNRGRERIQELLRDPRRKLDFLLDFLNSTTIPPWALGFYQLSEAGAFPGQMWAAPVELPWPGPLQEIVLKDTTPL